MACKEHGDIEDSAASSGQTIVRASNHTGKRGFHGILTDAMSPSPPVAHFVGAQGMRHEFEVDAPTTKEFSENHGAQLSGQSRKQWRRQLLVRPSGWLACPMIEIIGHFHCNFNETSSET